MATVLLVDDDPDIWSLLESNLAGFGHTVIVEHDGEAALAALEIESVDVVLLDWMMPRLGGLEVCLALRSDPRFQDLPVLMITARAQEADFRRALAAGADDYLLKPLSPNVVAARVAQALDRRKQSSP